MVPTPTYLFTSSFRKIADNGAVIIGADAMRIEVTVAPTYFTAKLNAMRLIPRPKSPVINAMKDIRRVGNLLPRCIDRKNIGMNIIEATRIRK